jgi:all-trans-retinol 13,14-reductase
VDFDAVVIGAGISGLVDAILLAETGRRVAVLEQHLVPGGFLQQFARKGTVFDIGFHYMGSTLPGRPIRRFLEHLKVWDRIRLIPFPEDAAIEVVSGEKRFGYPPRFDRFIEKARATWPHQTAGLDRFASEVRSLCSLFKWFDLRKGVPYQHPWDLRLPACSLEEYLAPLVTDSWLRQVLSIQSFNLGLHAREVPWVKYALAFRSNFDLTSRVEGGGGALVSVLLERGKELGVTYRFRSEAVSFRCARRRVEACVTSQGEEYEAEVFVAACHPKAILRRFRDEDIPAMFKERVYAMDDSRGALQVFLRLKEPVRSIGASALMLQDEAEARGEPPIPMMLVTNPCSMEMVDRGGPRLEAMTFIDRATFSRWADRPVMKRGSEYERVKMDLARRMIGAIARIAPELPSLIEDVYASTPLTAEWYTRNEEGGVFGISHHVGQQGAARPQTRIHMKNLLFTGHSITMPGICGVFINSFNTCELIRNDDLFGAVAS